MALLVALAVSPVLARAADEAAPQTDQVVSPDQARGWDRAPGVEPEDVALFLPRLVLFGPRVAFGIAAVPIREGLRATDRHHLVQRTESLIYWDARHTVGLKPTASYRSATGVLGGADLFDHDLLDHGERLDLSAVFGARAQRRADLCFEGDHVAGSRLWLESHALIEQNTPSSYAGIGMSDAADAPRTWYQEDRSLGLLRAGVSMGRRPRQLQVGGTLVASRRDFGPLLDEGGGRISIEEVYDTARVDGFDEGTTVAELDANLVIDLRRTPGLDTTGTRVETFIGHTLPGGDARLLHGGAELAHTINLYRHTRLLTLRGAVEAVDGDRIPMSELPRLGGSDRLRGYSRDRFRDTVATLLSAEYRYPIHHLVMGELFVDTGTVTPSFQALTDGAATWRTGAGGGLVLGDQDGIGLRVEVGYGEALHVFVGTDLARALDQGSTRP